MARHMTETLSTDQLNELFSTYTSNIELAEERNGAAFANDA
jgi:hypothetical protein